MNAPLQEIFDGCFRELGRGVVDRRHGFHVPAIATVGLDGAPQVRSVVLRRVDAAEGILSCHSDARSGKVAELAREPRMTWHFYAPELKLQLRVLSNAEYLRVGAVADEAWSRSELSSRRCYLAPRAPGAECDAPSPNLPPELVGRRPTVEESLPGREHFGVVRARSLAIDWLWLGADGHRRARFTRETSGAWAGAWIEP